MPDPAEPPMTRRTVWSNGLPLAVWEGPRSGPTLVFVHGFPDTHVVWNRVVAHLIDDFHCIVYDVRGAGESGVPSGQQDYRLEHLRADLTAVIDAVSPEAPVHLVGHDWGSIQAWDAVVRARSDARLTGRISTYTTISGPCLDHVSALAGAALRGGWDRKREALGQALHSWYILAFQVPVVPEAVLRTVNRRLVANRKPGRYHFADSLPDDAARGVNLYRANIGGHRPRVPGGPYTDIPVQLIVPTRDTYVTPAFYRDLPRFVRALTRVEIDAGHWAPHTRAADVARLISSFVTSRDGTR